MGITLKEACELNKTPEITSFNELIDKVKYLGYFSNKPINHLSSWEGYYCYDVIITLEISSDISGSWLVTLHDDSDKGGNYVYGQTITGIVEYGKTKIELPFEFVEIMRLKQDEISMFRIEATNGSYKYSSLLGGTGLIPILQGIPQTIYLY